MNWIVEFGCVVCCAKLHDKHPFPTLFSIDTYFVDKNPGYSLFFPFPLFITIEVELYYSKQGR